MTNIEGLINITSLDIISFTGTQLTDLNGLQNLTAINDQLVITDNSILENIDALQNVQNPSPGIQFWISGNPLLTFCSLPLICVPLSFSTFHALNNNGIGCESTSVVSENCDGIGRIKYPMFYDENEDGLLDSDEPFLTYASVTIDPENEVAYGNSVNCLLYTSPSPRDRG